MTTKLWNDDQGYDRALRAFDASLQRLGLDHVDLYLLHWPVAGKRLDSWRALDRAAVPMVMGSTSIARMTSATLRRLASGRDDFAAP